MRVAARAVTRGHAWARNPARLRHRSCVGCAPRRNWHGCVQARAVL